MKSKHLSLLVLPTILLSSCTFLFGVQSYTKDINVYDIDRLDAESNLSSGLQNTIRARFVNGKEYIPYLTLEQYASLYKKHFTSDTNSVVQADTFSASWTISRGDVILFVAGIDYFSNEIIMAGSIESAYKSDDDPRDLKALNYALKIDADGFNLGDTNYASFKFSGYKLTTFSADNNRYFPLGLLNITFSDSSGIYFDYNYSHILSTRDVDNYATCEYVDEGNTYTFNSQMKANQKDEVIPDYLRDYNANLFIYLMDNFYGLKSLKGIKSMASYYKEKGLYTNLYNSEPGPRTMAYSDCLSILDDNHTLLVDVNDTWGDPNYQSTRRYGEGCHNRSRIRAELKGYRDSYYDSLGVATERDVIYSADNKTALFSFDSFKFGSSKQVFNEDESIKDTAKNYDTYFLFLDMFNKIKQHGSVENIVIDISLNGGGTVGILMKLLALISKDDNGYISFYDDTTNQAVVYNTHVDINNDGKYDANDCFGNDFNFYLLTSDYSFSCANAFPCSAQAMKTAKIIGQKSGGGECAVSVHHLPNSEYVYHSSNLHLGLFDEQQSVFKGFEAGATPDIELAIDADFYSIEKLNTAIANAQ